MQVKRITAGRGFYPHAEKALDHACGKLRFRKGKSEKGVIMGLFREYLESVGALDALDGVGITDCRRMVPGDFWYLYLGAGSVYKWVRAVKSTDKVEIPPFSDSF